jgi:hypothetical protein
MRLPGQSNKPDLPGYMNNIILLNKNNKKGAEAP